MLGLVGTLILSGCFTYLPVEPGVAPEGREVRVHVSRQGLAALPEIPDAAGAVVRGTLLDRGGDVLLVRMPIGTRVDGVMSRSIGQNVSIPSQYVDRLEAREFSRGRTGMFVAAALTVAIAAVLGFGEGAADPVIDPRDPPVESARIPVFSLLSSLGWR